MRKEMIPEFIEMLNHHGYKAEQEMITKANGQYSSLSVEISDFVKIQIRIDTIPDDPDEALKAVEELVSKADDAKLNDFEYRDYSMACENLVLEAIDTESNQEFLNTVPHREVCDLSVVARIVIPGGMSTVVTNSMVDSYGISAKQLFSDAVSSYEKKLKISSLADSLQEMGGFPPTLAEPRLKVVTTKDRIYGSGVIYCNAFLKAVADCIGSDYYILPSSIHEVICLPVFFADSVDFLREMVTSINRDVVNPEEKLSDNVYVYNVSKGIIEEA